MENFHPVQLAYNVFEPVNGTDMNLAPILFLHGVSASKEHWRDIPQKIANVTKRKAYALDARNHGDSEWSDQFNFDINVDDLIHFLEIKNISKAILVGHSMGGMTAIKSALRRPDLIEKIVVEDMAVKKASPEIIKIIELYLTLYYKAIETAPPDLDERSTKKFIVDYMYSHVSKNLPNLRRSDKELDDHVIMLKRENNRFVSKANFDVILRVLKEPENIMSEVQGLYEGPACFIYGNLSPFLVGNEKDHIRQFFPNAVFECTENAYHSVHDDCPDEFIKSVLNFLS